VTRRAGTFPDEAFQSAPEFLPIWSCSVWGLPCPPHCCGGGALLPHLFTLTPLPGRYVFCGTFRRADLNPPSRTLSGTLLCGVRTFLSHRLTRRERPSGPAVNFPIIADINAVIPKSPRLHQRGGGSRAHRRHEGVNSIATPVHCRRFGDVELGSQPRRRALWAQRIPAVGTWLSLVEHSLGVRGVGSSNLPVPTILHSWPAERSDRRASWKWELDLRHR
jgi:hypothetical protein